MHRGAHMQYVTSPESLLEVAAALADAPLIGADTEAAGYHRYFDRACLVQISTREETFLIDPLALESLEPLERVFSRPETEIIFHDADYDLRLLSRDFGITVSHLFDTKLAAQILGEPAIGLASVLEKFLGIKLEKKFQKADWAQRPLPPEMLAYAAEDTRHLPALRDAMDEALVQAGRRAWAQEEFEIQRQVRGAESVEDPEAYLRMKGIKELTPRELAVLRELHQWRESVARERDMAPFRVIGNDALIEMARRKPEDAAALGDIPGSPRSLVERHGRTVLNAIRRALALPEEGLPARRRGPPRPPPDAALDARVERLRAARDKAAEQLGLDRGFLMPRAQLEQLATVRPRTIDEMAEIPGFRRWQAEATGELMLGALNP